MDAFITRYSLSILLLTSIGTSTGSNETNHEESREPRVSGRIVKLYTGAKPEPYVCTVEGFQADPNNCAVFYRCVKEQNGKFTVFRYQCAPGTVYDPDVETCNHARSTRRTECGGMLKSTTDTSKMNEIDVVQSEVPRPISTKVPIYYTEQTTFRNPTALPWILPTQHQSIPTKMPWGSSISPSTHDANIHETTKSSGSTVGYQWSSPTQDQTKIEYTFKTTTPPKSIEISHLEKNEPCTSDGFMGDSENCRKFYRCVGNQRGGYLKYEFSCSESTVWDDDIQGCNHPWDVRRSKCGRSLSYEDKSSLQKQETRPTEKSTTRDPTDEMYGYKFNKTIQQQLQISHGSKVTQTQTQISNSNEVIQNQTQINYGGKVEKNKKPESKQNQTQISYGAISQTQTQIDYGNKGVQTQLQIDHSKDSSQSQVQIQDSTTAHTVITSTQNSNSGNNKCSKSGFMGDESDCKKFYRCVDNGRGTYTRFEYFCGDGTVWDPELEACNHAWAVKHCGGTLSQEPTSEEHTTTTMKSTEYHTEPKTTQTYYTNQVLNEDNEDDVGVGYGNQINQGALPSTTMKTTTTTMKSTTNAEKSNTTTTECTSSGFIGEANDCKIFYRCVDNGRGGFTKHEFKCGDGTVWDPDIEACNHAWAAKNCGGSASNNVDIQESTTKIANTTPSWNVSSIVTLIQTTTQASIQIDDYDTGYGSQNQETSTTIRTIKPPQEQENDKNDKCKYSGFMGDTNNCKKFYRCVDDGNGGYIKYEFTCGEGTVWDPKIDACNHVWNVEKCGGSNNVIENIENTSQSIPITSDGDTSSVLTTQSNKVTDKPVYTITTSTTSSTTTSSSTSSVCSNSGFMGDSSDCKTFYRCVNNGDGSYTRYEFTCGEGTVWDPKLEACNHAWAVENCGGNVETTSQSIATTSYGDTSSLYITQGNQDTDKPSITTTTSTTSSSTTSSVTSNDCTNSGFMGDSSNCKRFYRCVDNGDGSYTRYEFTCGEGTVWDPKIEACNHAWAVENCGGGGSEPTHINQETTSQHSIMQDEEQENGYATPSYNTSNTPQIITSTSPSSVTLITSGETSHCNKTGFMGDKSDCKKFYRCVDNGNGGYDRYEFMCGEGTVWDESIEACNHAWVVKDCGQTGSSTTHVQNESTTQSTSSSITSEIGQTTEKVTTTAVYHETDAGDGCMKEGFFGNKKDCKKFYRCVDNGKGSFTKYEFTCGEGTSWSQYIQACDHITPDRPCNVLSQEPIYLNDDMETQSTSTTKATVSTEKTESESTQATKKPQAAHGTCESEGFYGNPSDCKKFYRCIVNGNGGYTKYDFNCGDGTVWNQEIQACDHESEDKTCSGSSSSQSHSTESQSESTTSSYSTTKQQEATDKTQPPQTMASECISEGFFAHTNDCKKFIRCVSNGKGGYTRYEFSCGDGTVWVQEMQACDHDNDITSCSSPSGTTLPPENSEEHSPSTPHSNVMSSTESITPNREDDEYDTETSIEPSHDEIDDCTSEGYFANKNDCRKFYRCVDNGNGGYTKYDFACGEGTAWDSDLQTCNHIKEVQSCSGSTQEGSGYHQTTTDKNQAQTENTSSTTKPTTSSSETPGGSTSSSNSQDYCESEGYFGDSNDCKKFYRCVDNGNGGYTKYDFKCGDGTIWDQDINTCNHPQDVSNPSCRSDQGTSDTSSTTTSTATSSTTSSTTESSTIGQGTSDCSQESTKQPGNNSVTCDKAGYYANPNDCKKFYRCVDWDGDGKQFSVFHFECGEGTIWDPAVDTCNHEDSVYPKRDCSQSQSVAGETTTITTTETTTSEQTTTQKSTTSEQTTTEQSTTQQSTTSEKTTTQASTSSEQTTQQITSENTTIQEPSTTKQTTTQQPTTSEATTTQESTSTTSQPNTSEQTTTQETTSEQTTTQQTSSSEQTSEQTTTQQTTTPQSITSEQTTTQQSTTSEQTTTQESTTSEQTTQQSTTSETTTTQQSTATEQTTTQQSTTSEQTTTQQSTSEQTTTQESTTSEQTTTQQSTTSEPTTTQQSTATEQTTTQQSTTSEQTTTQQSTSEHTTTQESTTSDQTTTQQSTTSEQTTTQESTSEPSTTQQPNTSEQPTTQQSTSDQTTTEQSNQQTPTESTTTTEQTTDGITTTEQASTTQASSTEFDSTDQSTTEVPASSNKECPETDDDQYLLVCPTSFKRHPKYCNMFYQCTEDDETYEARVAIFKCPNNTIYDESQTQCVTEDKAEQKCDGEMANKRRFKRLGLNYKDPIVADVANQSCSGTGYFSFEKHSDCSKGFLKCERRKSGKLEGHVYQCPDGYIYWAISKRCERLESVRDCKRSSNDWTGRWNIPVERKNVAPS